MSIRGGEGVSTGELAEHLFAYAGLLDSEAAKAAALNRVVPSEDSVRAANALEERAKQVWDLANELYEQKEVVGFESKSTPPPQG